MSKAIYPGSFDPVTNGHMDVIRRGLMVFDELIVAVADNPGKQPLFTRAERMGHIREVTRDLSGIHVEEFDGLLVEYARRRGVAVVLRGIRTMSDFEYEYQMAMTNRTLAPDVETVFVMTHEEHSFVSSRLIKEAAQLGGDISAFVPKPIEEVMRARFGRKS
jgi:pantetheine-phosphate adenylyltransferase